MHLLGAERQLEPVIVLQQQGMLMNASMGGPAVTITSQEHLPFLDIEIPLSSRRAQDTKEKAGGSNTENKGSGIYEVTIPDIGQLLPSYKKSDMDQGELSAFAPADFSR